MTGSSWMHDHRRIAEALYRLSPGDTFAIRTEESWGQMTKYVRVTGGSYPDTKNYYDSGLAEPFDIILEGEVGKSPSADHFESMSISHDPESDLVYWKRGVGRFEEVDAVALNAMAVDYSSGKVTAARCECGQTYKMPVSDDDAPVLGQGMTRDGEGNLVTPCCRSSDWTTTLVDN